MSTAIVVGGAGALGRSIVNSLKKNSIKAISIDLVKNDDATFNVTIDNTAPLAGQVPSIKSQLKKYLADQNEGALVSGVVSSAGSWAGGSIGDDDFLETVQTMTKTNLDSALFAAHLSSKFLNDKGALILTGAEAALGPTPGGFMTSTIICYNFSLIQ
jgi:dihydropteridine reductase